MKNSTKIGMAIIAAASILGAAYVYAFTGVVEEKAIMAGCIRRRTGNCRKRRRCVGNSNFFGRSGTCISGCC